MKAKILSILAIFMVALTAQAATVTVTWAEVKEELQAAQKKESTLKEQLEKLNISLPNVVNKPVPAGLDAEQTKEFVEKVGVTPLDKFVA